MSLNTASFIRQLANLGSMPALEGGGSGSDVKLSTRHSGAELRQRLRAELSQFLPTDTREGDEAGTRASIQAVRRALTAVRPDALRAHLNYVIWAEARRFERRCRELELKRQNKLQVQRDKEARIRTEADQRWWSRTPQERRLWYLSQIKISTDYIVDPAHFVRGTFRAEISRLRPADRALLETDPRKLGRWLDAFTSAYGYFLKSKLEQCATNDDRPGAYRLIAEAYKAILTIGPSNLRKDFCSWTTWVTRRCGPSSARWAQLRAQAIAAETESD